ncbi:hypothetical protein ONS96_003740 [Cadophora gregata f. sp. sojae]|nr:hypothetical protein ONS96_003740 [Cadophora gregata f. sp. sojae]
MISRRNKYLLYISICLVFLVSIFRYQQKFPEISHTATEKLHASVPARPASLSPTKDNVQAAPTSSPAQASATPSHKFKYKSLPSNVPDPIIDNFPLAAAAHFPRDLPPIPPWNKPPTKHVPENTPLFIGFTRNWRVLQQVVVSYITAGWPPEDIYVVENTGVFDSNAKGLLSLQNPFFLNHTRLRLLGVNVLVTPALFSFAQLQNYYIFHSIEKGWKHYYWGHMDIVAVSSEDRFVDAESSDDGKEKEKEEDLAPAAALAGKSAKRDDPDKYKDFKSLYMNCVHSLREAMKKNETSGEDKRWAMRFFNYDKLALVNVAAYVEIGAWDTQIPYYMTDCDMHARINMANMEIKEDPAGFLIDIGESLNDLYTLYRKTDSPRAAFIDPQIVEKEKEEEEENKRSAEAEAGPAKGKSKKSILVTQSVDSESKSKRQAAPNLDRSEKGTHKREANQTSLHFSQPQPKSLNDNAWRAPTDTIKSDSFSHLISTLEAMQNSKATGSHGRNVWQGRQRGGQGDPFYRDPLGFERALGMTIEHGKRVFAEKWGHRDCDVWEVGLTPGDAWRVEKDWE